MDITSTRRDSHSSHQAKLQPYLMSEKFVLSSLTIQENAEGAEDSVYQQTESERSRSTCAKCPEEITLDFPKLSFYPVNMLCTPRKKCPNRRFGNSESE